MRNKNRYYAITLPLICGLFAIWAFLFIYGSGTLDVTNDNWILAGYDEHDIIQHYSGWVNFKDQPWQFPLGNTDLCGAPSGINIAFTDSIPIVAIIFKAFNSFLPSTFQYFGIYTLLTFFLQGVASSKLITLALNKKNILLDSIFAFVSSMFFVFSPILLDRGFRHTALASHYLILFSLYIYLEYRKKYLNGESENLPWIIILVSSLSIGIHPYLMPMCMIFVLLCSIEYMRYIKKYVKPILFLFANLLSAYAVGKIIGSINTNSSMSRSGYGYYSMNLNSLINPSSVGKYKWSYIFIQRNQYGGNYDGFNYLGFGFFLLIAFVTLMGIYNIIKDTNYKKRVSTWIKRNIYYLIICILLTLFAITNIITFDEKVIAIINLPDFILNLCGIFRASSRFFYPVYYSILLFCIYNIYLLFCNKKMSLIYSIMIVSLLFSIQIVDISNAIREKHNNLYIGTHTDNLSFSEILWNVELNSNIDNFEKCMYFDDSDIQYFNGNLHKILVFTGKNNLQTNALNALLSEKSNINFKTNRYKEYINLLEGNIVSNTLYVTNNYESFETARQSLLTKNVDVKFVEMPNIYFVIPTQN